jgi:hypothetical protein
MLNELAGIKTLSLWDWITSLASSASGRFSTLHPNVK